MTTLRLNHFGSWRKLVRLWILVAIATCVAAPATQAANVGTLALDPLQFKIDGTLTDVGKITVSLDERDPQRRANDDQITATAMLDAPFCNCGKFHWLQLIDSADKGTFDPLKYDGKPVNSADSPNALPVIDVPNPNYDGKPADDTLPWYLTAAEEGGSNPNLGGNTKNLDGSGTLVMIDQPNYGGFTFQTFFVAETGPKTFGVIAEFWWGYGSTGGASYLVPGPTDDFMPNAGSVTMINAALAKSGFGAWTAALGYDGHCVPEPASLALMFIGLIGLCAARRQAMHRSSSHK